LLECRITIAKKPVSLVKPLTYMNLSGEAVVLFASRSEFNPESLLAVCDDTALPLGRLRLRNQGSDGGHNGLGSIIETLGTNGFPRLRLGVGPVPEGADQADFVLSRLAPEDMKPAQKMARRAADCVVEWVQEGIDSAMTRYNTRGEAGVKGEDRGNGD
jgi:PTH1 family peptidyl-tRNA hydrolase